MPVLRFVAVDSDSSPSRFPSGLPFPILPHPIGPVDPSRILAVEEVDLTLEYSLGRDSPFGLKAATRRKTRVAEEACGN